MKINGPLSNLLAMVVFLTGLASIIFFAFYFYSLDAKNTSSNLTKTVEVSVLTPGQLISQTAKYNNQPVTVRGIIDQETVVCEKRECPVDDTCCGCPQNKNLILTEAQIAIENKLQTTLSLLGANSEVLCQRQTGGCQYDCPGWVKGAVYDVTGIFHGEKQLGLSVIVNLNLQVKSKEMVKKLSLFDSLNRFWDGLKQTFGEFKTSGTFVNH